jgi:CdiI immunity protein
MSQAAYPRLWHMFGAFFHQDWDTEGADWPDLVRNFSGGQPQSELDATAAELDRLVTDFPDDAALNHELFDVLCCSYLPRPDLGGPTVRAWLGQLAEFLRARATGVDG